MQMIKNPIINMEAQNMFLVWGSEWKYEIKPGGMRITKACPECGRPGEFYEVKPTKYFTAYFIPLFETESRRTVLECPHCKSHFYINESDYLSAKKERMKTKQAKTDSGSENVHHKAGGFSEKKHTTEKQVKKDSSNKVILECSCCYTKMRVPLLEQLIPSLSLSKRAFPVLLRNPLC
jgi:hypothetical protein